MYLIIFNAFPGNLIGASIKKQSKHSFQNAYRSQIRTGVSIKKHWGIQRDFLHKTGTGSKPEKKLLKNKGIPTVSLYSLISHVILTDKSLA
jgi:alpha-galactosidase